MDPVEQALRDSLKEDRYDKSSRNALIDFLEDHDRPEEAAIHRRWDEGKERKAWAFLIDFVYQWDREVPEDVDHYKWHPNDTTTLTVEDLIAKVLGDGVQTNFDTPDVVNYFGNRDKLREAVAQVTDREVGDINYPSFICGC